MQAQETNPTVAKFKADLLSRHLLASGATGQGKTVLTYGLIFNFVKLGLNFISLSFMLWQ